MTDDVLRAVAEDIVARQTLAGHPRWDDGSWQDRETVLAADNARLRAAIKAHRHGHLYGNGGLSPRAINAGLWATLGGDDD